MADFDSNLPIRGTTADLETKVGDGSNSLDIAVDGSTAKTNGVQVLGTDGTNAQTVSTDSSGHLQVDVLTGGGGPEDTDDDSVAGGQSAALGISLSYGWDGTDWQRLTTDASGSLDTNITLALPAGSNSIGTVGIDAGSNSIGSVGLDAGTNNIGDIGTLVDLENTDGSTVGTKGLLAMGTDGTNAQTIAVDSSGNVQVDIVSGAAGPEDTDDDAVAGGQTANLGISLSYGWDGTDWQRLTTDASGSLDVNLTAALPAGTNNIGDIGTIVDLEATDGSAALTKGLQVLGTDGTNAQIIKTDTNGVVQVNVTGTTATDQINDYDTATAVAASASDTHTYTVTGGKTLLLRGIHFAGSGRMKAEIKAGTAASETTRAVAFNSTANPYQFVEFNPPIEVSAADNVLVVRTNTEPSQSQDLYSTIIGEEV